MKLKYWQTLLLFIPIIVGGMIIALPVENFLGYSINLSISNFLFSLQFCLLFGYQLYLLLRYYKVDPKASVFVKVNAFIPVVFLVGYMLFVGYNTFINNDIPPQLHLPKGAMRVARTSYSGYMIVFFLIYGLVNFFFVNNQYVLHRIKKMGDAAQIETLRTEYHQPMRSYVRFTLWLFVGFTLLTFIADIFTLVSKG